MLIARLPKQTLDRRQLWHGNRSSKIHLHEATTPSSSPWNNNARCHKTLWKVFDSAGDTALESSTAAMGKRPNVPPSRPSTTSRLENAPYTTANNSTSLLRNRQNVTLGRYNTSGIPDRTSRMVRRTLKRGHAKCLSNGKQVSRVCNNIGPTGGYYC